MVQISPSLLSADFSKLGDEIRLLEKAGADLIHIDVMDGHFVPNLTIGAPVVKSLRPVTKLPFDVHLMMTNPEDFIRDFHYAGADILTVHVEIDADVREVLHQIHEKGMKAGLSLRPHTPVEDLLPYLDETDVILVMSVEPGFGGQIFMPISTDRIKKIKRFIGNRNIQIEVDGGINAETAAFCRQAGADILVSGSYLLKSDSYAKTIRKLKGESDD